MAQWGRNITGVTANSSTTKETSNGAPIGTFALVKGADPVSMGSNSHFGNTSPGSRANVDVAMFANTTVGAFIANKAVGVFAVNTAMMNTVGGNVDIAYVSTGGSGYQQNTINFTPAVTNGGTGASVNAVASTTTNPGKIVSLNIVARGSGYVTAPSLPIPAPSAITLVANTTGVVAATNFLKITSANSYWQANDRFFYAVAAGNTAITPLTGNTYYYVAFANTTGITISATQGGANIVITDVRTTTPAETGHTIKGDTATGYVDVNTVYPPVTHAGWVLRTEGTGGRAGRVHYETLVAMGSLGDSGAAYGTAPTVTSNTLNDPLV